MSLNQSVEELMGEFIYVQFNNIICTCNISDIFTVK